MKYLYITSLLLFLNTNLLFCQKDDCIAAGGIPIRGQIVEKNQDKLDPLNAVKIFLEEYNQNTTSDNNGGFKICVDKNSLPLTIKFIDENYITQVLIIEDEYYLNTLRKKEDLIIIMEEGEGEKVYEDIIPKLENEISTPLTIIDRKALEQTGKFQLDRALTYTIPSFNATQQAISDGAAHFDPFDLRGLGSSRTLVLINGKRKNLSSYLNIQDVPNKSEVGIDFRSIPFSAIEKVVVLRDGETVRYGSDAIAGVINLVLKKDVFTNVNAYSGITSSGDGFLFNTNISTGTAVGNKGFLNIGAEYTQQFETNRIKPLFVDAFFNPTSSEHLEWIENNPTLGMKFGVPNTTNLNAYYNFETSLKSNFDIYSFGTFNKRRGQSYAIYRTPYWEADTDYIFHSEGEIDNGFLPELILDIEDVYSTIGVKKNDRDWTYDLSFSTGRHRLNYTAENTFNRVLGEESPISFNAGGYEFSTQILDFTSGKRWETLTLETGGQFRSERFQSFAGQVEAYMGEGAISFPGLRPSNEVNKSRYNVGGFVKFEQSLFEKKIFLGLTGRLENYSDFGTNSSYKATVLYKLSDDIVFRGGYTTGFRAPSLHQYYLSNVQTVINGNSISNQGTFNHESSILRILNVKPLQEETSKNLSLGSKINFQIDKNNRASKLKGSIDITAYSIKIEDRIIFSGDIDKTFTSISPILEQFNLDGLKFFINAIDTRTNGIDLGVTLRNVIGSPKSHHRLNVNLVGNLLKHEIIGDLKLPEIFTQEEDKTIFNRQERSRVISARPSSKFITKFNYRYSEWFEFDFIMTRFGQVKWAHPTDENKDQVYSPKWVADIGLSFPADYSQSREKKWKVRLSINNIFSKYADPINIKGDNFTNLGGRFYYPWEVNQFDFLGANFLLSFSYKIR